MDEQSLDKRKVVSSNLIPATSFGLFADVVNLHQTVNLRASGFLGSSPRQPTIFFVPQ